MAGSEVGTDAVQGRGEYGAVGDGFCFQRGSGHRGLEVRDAVDGDGAVGVFEDDGGVAGGRVGAQVDSCACQEAGGDAEPVGGVVVSADHDDRCVQVGKLVQSVVEQAYGVEAGDGPVVDVSGYQDGVDVLGSRRVDQMVEENALGGYQVF